MKQILGFELKAEKSDWGISLEFLGAAIHFLIARSRCVAQLSIPPDRVEKLIREIKQITEQKQVSLPQLQRLVGKLNFAQTSTMGKTGRVAMRPVFALVMRGGGQRNERSRWALKWRLRLLLNRAPRMVKPIGRTVDVRIYSDACATRGGMAAVAFFSRRHEIFAVLIKGAAEHMLLESLKETNGIFGLEMFATVAAIATFGDQLKGKRMILFLDNNAAAGASTKASSRIQMILATLGSF